MSAIPQPLFQPTLPALPAGRLRTDIQRGSPRSAQAPGKKKRRGSDKNHPFSHNGEQAPNFPDISMLRSIRKLQLQFEIGFCNPETGDWPPEAEVLAGTPAYHELARWFLLRKPFFHPSVLDTYYRLLRRHMKGKTITAHVSIDPEDGWTFFEFTVYGFPPLSRKRQIYQEHDDFLVALFHEGLQYRHLDLHVGLTTVDGRYRPARSAASGETQHARIQAP